MKNGYTAVAKKLLVQVLVVSFLFAGCSDLYKGSRKDDIPNNKNISEQLADTEKWNVEESPLNGMPFTENKFIYKDDRDDEVITLYITAYPTPDQQGKLITLGDFDSHQAREMDYNPEVEVIVQEGDENGPSTGRFGYNSIEPNAMMRVRGHSARGAIYKSFKVKLYDRAGTWRGQNTLNLNKHPYDTTKVTNKFCFDYFEKLSDIGSFKTKFVHLFVKDMSLPKDEREFKDYGLYTHIEQPNKTFLRNHGLDEEGNMYKAKSFEFLRYSDKLKLESDPGYNREEFESVLGIREGKGHEKLLKMLDDVNNVNLDFNNVFDKHFNRDNYLTWMAANILFGNEDTVAQNYLIYSPQNSLTWYFMPWDYDGALRFGERMGASAVPDSMYGVGRYWGVILHRRFFRDPKNVDSLTSKMEEMMKVITPENTKSITDNYKSVIRRFLYTIPDLTMISTTPDKIEPYLDDYQMIVEYNKSRYIKALNNPMPVFTAQPEQRDNGSWIFSWDASYDIQGDLITYDFEIARDISFSDLVFSSKGITSTTITVPRIASGRYYWRLIIKDDKGNMQYSFNNIKLSDSGTTYWGVSEFIVR